FFFSSRRRHTRSYGDWSSDVCSSDLPLTSATVSVVGTRLSAQSDGAGRYTLTGVPVGPQRLRARMLGYAPADTSVVLVEGEETEIGRASCRERVQKSEGGRGTEKKKR